MNQLASRPKATRLLNESFARSAMRITRRNRNRKSASATVTPMKPSSSPTHGEDEVGVLLGKEREPLLRAVEISPAQPAAGADRDLRLHDVLAAAARIDRRIEEDLSRFC